VTDATGVLAWSSLAVADGAGGADDDESRDMRSAIAITAIAIATPAAASLRFVVTRGSSAVVDDGLHLHVVVVVAAVLATPPHLVIRPVAGVAQRVERPRVDEPAR